ncbi:MAG: ABC transporter permease [Phycisphaerae bacterium]|nr:ABC transporter permease [Phycisphaerae bacterium]
MSQAVLKYLRYLNPANITGPIFAKELRVASRRRRYYLLRIAYLLSLFLFVILLWQGLEDSRQFANRNYAYYVTRMADMGKMVISQIVWFQFLLIPLIAVIITSTAITEEISRGSFQVLLSTPITNLQIILGKILSRLLQVTILATISVPLLLLVRIFGGVPWDYVVGCFCITLTTALWMSAVTMFFSTRCRTIPTTILVSIIVGVLLPLAVATVITIWLGLMTIMGAKIKHIAIYQYYYCSPIVAMDVVTNVMLNPARAIPHCYWFLHCLVALGMTAAALKACVHRMGNQVRKKALGDDRQLSNRWTRRRIASNTNEYFSSTKNQDAETADLSWHSHRQKDSYQQRKRKLIRQNITHVTGSPITWREKRIPLLRSQWLWTITITACIIVFCLGFPNWKGGYGLYVVVLFYPGILLTAITSASTITAEKESRRLVGLLCTPMLHSQIIWGKALGAMRRSLPGWLPLITHMLCILSLGFGRSHPILILHLAIIAAGCLIFTSGCGIFFSTILKRTSTAIMATLAVLACLWIILPMLLSTIGGTGGYETIEAVVMQANPMAEIAIATCGNTGRNVYPWSNCFAFTYCKYDDIFSGTSLGFWEFTTNLLIWLGIYSFAGIVLGRLSTKRLRRGIL